MKKILCLIIAILMLLSVACTEASVDESSSTAEESITNISDDINSNSLDNSENPEAESSKTETSGFVQENSKETSDESSEPSYVFRPRNEAKGNLICDHGAIFGRNWFHYFESPFVGIYTETQTIETGIKHGVVPMTCDELEAWLFSETPDEYKFVCNVPNPDASTDEGWYDVYKKAYKDKNVVMFLRQFDVDKEAFTRDYYYNWQHYYGMYHDLDVLFDWDYQDACNWYLDYYNKYREILEAKIALGTASNVLRRRYISNAEDMNVSAAQLIYEKNIPREEVEGLIEQYLTYYISHNEKLHTGEVVISYKLDEVYNQSDEFMELLEKVENGEIYPLEVDDWFIDIQYN